MFDKSLLKYSKPKFNFGDRVRDSKNDIPFRKGYKPLMKFLKFWQYLQKNLLHTSSKISKKKKFWENFMRKSRENVQIRGGSFVELNFYRSVVMDSSTLELVPNASFICSPNNSLSSYKKFLPEQIHLKGEWEVAISKISYTSLYQNVTEGMFDFT